MQPMSGFTVWARLFAWLWVLVLLTASPAALAAKKPQLWVLEDPHRIETIASVSEPGRQDDFRSVLGGFSSGYTRSVHWFRLQLDPPPQLREGTRHWMLEMMPPYLDDLRVYLPSHNAPERFDMHRHGDRLPFAERAIRHRAFVQRVTFEHDEPMIIFIRLETTSSALLTVRARLEPDFLDSAKTEYALIGLLLGIILASLVANLGRLGKGQGQLAPAFVLYLLIILLHLLAINGLIAEFLLPTSPYWSDHLTSASTSAIAMAAAHFYRVALQLDRYFPAISRAYQALIWFFALLLPASFVDFYVEAASIMFLGVFAMLVTGMVISVVLMRRKIEGGKALLAAQLFSLVVSLVAVLTLLGLFPGDLLLIFAHQIGFLGNIAAIQWLMIIRGRDLQQQMLAEQQGRAIAETTAAREHTELEEQRRFIAMLTHELKTPLSVIQMNLGSVQPSESMRNHARQAVSDMEAVIDRVAQAVRLRDGVALLPGRQCQLIAVVEDCLAGFRGAGRAVQLTMTPHGRVPPPVMCEPVAFGSIIRNLLDNAFKYGKPDIPVRLVWHECENAGRPGLEICVFNAVGRAGRPDPSRVFEKYYRAPNAHSRVGSGLGLYIIRGLVEKNKGTIELLPGTTEVVFALWLPQ